METPLRHRCSNCAYVDAGTLTTRANRPNGGAGATGPPGVAKEEGMKHIDTFKLMARAIAPAEMGGGIDLGSVADLCTEVESLRAGTAKLEAQCADLTRQRTRREKALEHLPDRFAIDINGGLGEQLEVTR